MKQYSRHRLVICLRKVFLAGMLLFPAAAAAIPCIWTSSGIKGGDLILQFIPWWIRIRQTLMAGRLPWWDASCMMGVPVMADPQSALLYPPNWILLLPFWMEYQISGMILAHLILGSILTIHWLRSRDLPDTSIVTGALIFSWSGFMMAHTGAGHYSMICCAAWLPAVFHLSDRVAGGGGAGSYVKLGFVMGIQGLAGHPQTWILSILGSAAVVLFSRSGRTACSRMVGFAAAVAIASAINTGPILTGLELASLSARQAESGNGSIISRDSLPLENIIRVVFQDLTDTDAGFSYGGRESFLETYNYLGILPFLFIPYAASVKNRPYWLIMIAGLLLAVAPGYPVFAGMMQHIPLIRMFRGWSRAMLLFTSGMAVLASEGLAVAQDGPPRLKPLFSVISALMICCLLAFFLAPAGIQMKITDWISFRSVSRSLVTGVILTAFWRAASGLRMPAFLPWFATCLLLVDYHPVQRMFIQPSQGIISGMTRIFHNECIGKISSSGRVVFSGMPFLSNWCGVFGLSTVNGYRPLPLGRFEEYFNVMAAKPQGSSQVSAQIDNPSPLARAASVQFYAGTVHDDPALVRARNPECRSFPVFEDTLALPRIYIAESFEVTRSSEATLSRLTDGKFNVLRGVLLERDPQGPIVTGGSETRKASFVSNSDDEIRVALSGRGGGFLILTDAWYPGWQAWVDGRPTGILVANHLFRAVPIEETTSEVVFRYVPGWRSGAFIASLISIPLVMLIPILRRSVEFLHVRP